MRTILLYNPVAGRNRQRRRALLEAATEQLRSNGFAPVLIPTTAPGSAGLQARQAIESGAEAVFACGGDGTVHEVLQGVAGSTALFGILPVGSANALARELHLSRNVLLAAKHYRPHACIDLPLSVVRRPNLPDRYFLSMAGAGPDGALTYRMLTVDRGRWGRWLYYAHALRLFLPSDFATFRVQYRSAKGEGVERRCVSAMALRIGSLGGAFGGIARGASLRSGNMRVLLVHPPARVSLPALFLSSWMGLARLNPLLTVIDTEALSLQHAPQLQADGEWLGRTPAQIELLQQTVRLLVPPTDSGRVKTQQAPRTL